MTDIEKGLLTGKGKKQSKEYMRRFDECELRVITLKNKNNELQRQCDNEMESDIRQAIKLQASFLEVTLPQTRKKSSI
jgi:histidinol dehydrogenase